MQHEGPIGHPFLLLFLTQHSSLFLLGLWKMPSLLWGLCISKACSTFSHIVSSLHRAVLPPLTSSHHSLSFYPPQATLSPETICCHPLGPFTGPSTVFPLGSLFSSLTLSHFSSSSLFPCPEDFTVNSATPSSSSFPRLHCFHFSSLRPLMRPLPSPLTSILCGHLPKPHPAPLVLFSSWPRSPHKIHVTVLDPSLVLHHIPTCPLCCPLDSASNKSLSPTPAVPALALSLCASLLSTLSSQTGPVTSHSF